MHFHNILIWDNRIRKKSWPTHANYLRTHESSSTDNNDESTAPFMRRSISQSSDACFLLRKRRCVNNNSLKPRGFLFSACGYTADMLLHPPTARGREVLNDKHRQQRSMRKQINLSAPKQHVSTPHLTSDTNLFSPCGLNNNKNTEDMILF